MGDLQSWAQNRAGGDDGAAPVDAGDEAPDGQQEPEHEFTGEEPQDAMEFVAKECGDAIEALKKVLDKFEDADVANELIESLQECSDKATEAAKTLAEASEEEPDDENEQPQGEEQPNE
jgi:hypothetical protein